MRHANSVPTSRFCHCSKLDFRKYVKKWEQLCFNKLYLQQQTVAGFGQGVGCSQLTAGWNPSPTGVTRPLLTGQPAVHSGKGFLRQPVWDANCSGSIFFWKHLSSEVGATVVPRGTAWALPGTGWKCKSLGPSPDTQNQNLGAGPVNLLEQVLQGHMLRFEKHWPNRGAGDNYRIPLHLSFPWWQIEVNETWPQGLERVSETMDIKLTAQRSPQCITSHLLPPDSSKIYTFFLQSFQLPSLNTLNSLPDGNIDGHLCWAEQKDILDAGKQGMMLTRFPFYKRKLYGR